MALPKQQFIDRCNAWLDEFNNGNQLNIDDHTKCPIHAWVVHNHQVCGKDLVPNITNCEICGYPMCPNCSNHGATQISRVTGYMGDVAGWNAGKKQELKERQRHNLMDLKVTGASDGPPNSPIKWGSMTKIMQNKGERV